MKLSFRALALLIALTLGACTRNSQNTVSGTAGLDPGPMLEANAIGEPFLWRQRVSAHWADRSEAFDAVLQLHGDELVLMGISPLGRPGFIITLLETGVTFENRTGRRLPFPPEHIIADVQKVFYPWLPTVAPDFTGTRVGEHGILTVTETHSSGILQERAFRRSDAPERGELRVRYESWQPGLAAPERAVLENAWFGYTLTIVTVEQQALTTRLRD